MSLSEMEALKNKVEAVNKLHDFMNRFIPLIQKSLEGFKITKDGRFFKKYEEIAKEITWKALDDVIVKTFLQEMKKPSQIRCWHRTNRYNIFWQFDITYEDKNGSKIYENQFYAFGNYLDKNNKQVWTANEYVPKRTNFTYEEVAKEITWKALKERIIKEHQDEIDSHKHNYYPFLREQIMTIKTIPVKDASFQNLPEIKDLCPCAIHVYECQIAGEGVDEHNIELGRKFKVARVLSYVVFANHIVYGIYPEGDGFAEKTLIKLLKN